MYYNQIPSNYTNYMSPNVMKSGQVYIANRGLQHINCILPAQHNKGALYLGDVVCTLKTDLLEKHQIKSILTCMVEPLSRLHHTITSHRILPIRDTLEFPISFYFNQAKTFIDQSRLKGNNVLVHCHAGVSRSAAIVCAYLMLENNWNTETALQFVRQKRYRAKPNASFFNQLKIFQEKQINKITQNPKKASLKEQKIIVIKLDQEVQTHDELLFLELRRNARKQNKRNLKPAHDQKYKQNYRRYDLSKRQSNEEKKQKRIFKTSTTQRQSKQQSSTLHMRRENQTLKKNGSDIHFNKAFDPKLTKNNGEIKNNSTLVNQIYNNNDSNLNGKIGTHQFMSKSMLNPNSKNISLIINNQDNTPVKQKNLNQNNKVIINTQSSKSLNSEVSINFGQKLTKNYSRQSLTGQTSSYKQFS